MLLTRVHRAGLAMAAWAARSRCTPCARACTQGSPPTTRRSVAGSDRGSPRLGRARLAQAARRRAVRGSVRAWHPACGWPAARSGGCAAGPRAIRNCSHSSGRRSEGLRAPGEGQQYLRNRPMERRARGPVYDRLVAHTVSTSSACDRRLTLHCRPCWRGSSVAIAVGALAHVCDEKQPKTIARPGAIRAYIEARSTRC